MRTRGTRRPGLAAELRRGHRLTWGILAAVLLLSVLASGYLVLVSQARVTTYVRLADETRDLHEGMLDQETGLDAWLATGDRAHVSTYESGRAAAGAAQQRLLHDTRGNPDGTADLVRTLLSRQRWEAWAASVSETAGGRHAVARLRTRGSLLFDGYRASERRTLGVIEEQRAEALSHQRTAVESVLVGYLLLIAAGAALAVRRQRRLRRTVVAPMRDLHDTIVALRAGELTARAPATDVPELAEMGTALAGLATELSRAGAEAAIRERRLARLAYRFETVVRVGREIAGSLSVHYVSTTVTTAAAELLNSSAVLWLRGENGAFEVAHRSRDPHGLAQPGDALPPVIVARAAADAQIAVEAGRSAYPLVLAGRVTAVLEVGTATVNPDTEQVLTALLSTAAASLESAHLHSTARDLADLDGLTHLPNRRRFEVDVQTEWERCRRYGRPLSLVMMDLDHFKRLNDEHGHLLGDQVLREVARVLNEALRTSDTAYRYGGEEIVILLRETGLDDATTAADRLRGAVAALVLHEHREVRVTASAGVATRRSTMGHYHELLAAADGALYEAKHLGRNRVLAAGSAGETLVHGDSDGSLLREQVGGS